MNSKAITAFSASSITVLFVVPVVGSLWFVLKDAFDGQAWMTLFQHPQLWPALQLSLLTGFATTMLSLLLALLIIYGFHQSRRWQSFGTIAGAILAFPHLAMAIGVSLLVMPSGLIARVLALGFTQWQTPPQWTTTHDPYGIFLVAALTLKETPFLLWVMFNTLNQDDIGQKFALQKSAALSLGHSISSIWLRIFLPQILPLVVWPLLVVFIFAATVVDVSLVIGPTQPPTFSNLVWADINAEQTSHNLRGLAGAVFLTGMVLLTAAFTWLAIKLLLKSRRWLSAGPTQMWNVQYLGGIKFAVLQFIYGAVVILIFALAVTSAWPFPNLWPGPINLNAWRNIIGNLAPLLTSLWIAILATVAAMGLIVFWFETQKIQLDRYILYVAVAVISLPALSLGLGEYRLALYLGQTGTALGLFLVHLLPVVAYCFVVLAGPYRGFDGRWQSSASGLMSGHMNFLLTIKWPMLKAPLLNAAAIGFAVSFGQFVPAQLLAAGRFSTLPMEAVTLTAGSNRPLTTAFALLLMLPPLLVFSGAGYLARSRWRNT